MSQFRSPRIYISLFSSSMALMSFSKLSKNSGGALGGLYTVDTRNGLLCGFIISIQTHLSSGGIRSCLIL